VQPHAASLIAQAEAEAGADGRRRQQLSFDRAHHQRLLSSAQVIGSSRPSAIGHDGLLSVHPKSPASSAMPAVCFRARLRPAPFADASVQSAQMGRKTSTFQRTLGMDSGGDSIRRMLRR
jgi:hypothetical protein